MPSKKAAIVQCLKQKYICIYFCLMYEMLNLSLKELRLIAKNRNTNVYKSIPKDKLLRIINKSDRFINKK